MLRASGETHLFLLLLFIPSLKLWVLWVLNPAKMSLYPSLEDLKVNKVIGAQNNFSANSANPAIFLNEEKICVNVVMVSGAPIQGQLVARSSSMNYMVAPVTGNDVGIHRAEIKQRIREVILCKDQNGKIGLRLKSIDNGIFVQLVQTNSPASLVGLRFGDQVLQINSENLHKVLKQKITMTIRDRPFKRMITMHKDSTGHVVKDSSTARNGLLTEHKICEINGQNVIGLKDSQIADILSTSGTVVTITIIPAFIFEHIIKWMAPSIMKSLTDHTIPEV
uniref:PDZ domain-containing protein n=1 Tax=Rhinopithecus roxellana TaxID=61622 RepID=A0A2K6R313_RHIRO